MSLIEKIQNEEKPMNIEERLEALQKELNAWKRYTRGLIATGVLIIVGVLVVGCMLGKDKISAQRFTLVDARGKPRAALGMISGGGQPALVMFDSQGLSCATLGIDPEGRTVLVMGAAQGQGAALSIGLDGTPSLLMFDAQGKTRLGFGVNHDGFPMLGMRDAQGKIRVSLGLDLGVMPLMAMYDAQGQHRVSLGVDSEGAPELWISDAQGKTIWSAP